MATDDVFLSDLGPEIRSTLYAEPDTNALTDDLLNKLNGIADQATAVNTTDDISEGSNRFYTDERVDDRVANLIAGGLNISVSYDDANGSLTIDGPTIPVDSINGKTGTVSLTTGDIAEDSNNQYFTEERAEEAVYNLLSAGTNVSLDYDDGNDRLTISTTGPVKEVNGETGVVSLKTDDISEGNSNRYFTDERAQDAIASFITPGNGVLTTHDDAGNSLIISAGIDVSDEGSQVAEAYALNFIGSYVTAQNDGTGKAKVTVSDPPVDSVAGKTGAVTLDASDISGLATVATSGDWADLTGREEWLGYALSDESSDISTGFALSDHVVGARTIKELRAGIQQGSEPSDQKILIDLHKNGSSILSTRLQIDVGEDSSVTAANQPVFSDTSLADDDYIEFYIDQTGGTTPGKALKVRIRTEV